MLGTAGGFIGGAIGGPGGARTGWAVGTLLGAALEGSKSGTQNLGKLDSLDVTGSGYGAAIPWIYGRHRTGGIVIWSTRLQESSKKSGVRLLGTRRRTYSYSVSCAVMICRGPITAVRKIWADDLLIYDVANDPATKYDVEVYLGSWNQEPDPTLVAALGAADTPAYRGRAYVVFKDLPLADWGNRLPNFQFEVESSGGLGPIASDDFNRADGNVDTSSSGHPWLFDTLEGTIVGNTAYTDGTPGKPNWIECNEADVEVELTLTDVDLVGSGFIVFRLADEDNNWVFGDEVGFDGDYGTTGSRYRLQKREAGTYTTFASGPSPNAASTASAQTGDVLRVTCLGDAIRCYVNGVQVIHAISSYNQTETKHGFSANSGAPIDDWSCTAYDETGGTTLGVVLEDVFEQVGLQPAEWDVTEAIDPIDGLRFDGRTEARQALAPLLQVYATDLVERDGLLASLKRGGAAVVTIPEEDLAARVWSAGDDPPSPVQVRRLQELELPFRVDLAYHTAAKDYEIATQGAMRYTKQHLQEAVTLQTTLVFTDDAARQKAEELLYRLWVEREGFTFSLPPRYSYLTPGDVIGLPVAGGTARARITRLDMALPGPIRCEAVLDDVDVLEQVVAGGELTDIGNIGGAVEDTDLIAWSGNAVVDEDADTLGIYVAAGPAETGYWPGAELNWSRDGGASYQPLGPLTDPMVRGVADTVLAAGTGTAIWDTTNTVDIEMINGTVETVSDSEVLAGENRALLGDEIIGFAVVTPQGGNVFRLSRLLRGQRGTDPYWDDHAVGDRFVLLEDGLYTRVTLPDDLVGADILLKAPTADGQALADAAPVTVTVTGNEWLPYTVVNVTGERDGSNNLTLEWQRRSRVDGEMADYSDVPLGETTEEYRVQVMSGMTVLRTITVSSPTASYSAANQTLDGLTPGNPVTVRIAQLGRIGYGYVREVTV